MTGRLETETIRYIFGKMLSDLFVSESKTIEDIVNSNAFNFAIGTSDQWLSLSKVAMWSSIVCLVTVGIIVLLWLAIRPVKKHISSIRLQTLFICALLFNFIVYDVGMCTGDFTSLWSNAPMAIIHAFEAFLLNSDVSAIHAPFHESWIFMLFFSLGHLLAAIVSTLFIIKHFGYNLMSRLRLFNVSRFGKKVNHTYIFWGFNEASKNLVKGIFDHYRAIGSDDFRIIVIRANAVDDEADSHIGIDRVFQFLSLKSNEIEFMEKHRCLTTSTYVNPANVESSVEKARGNILHSVLHLHSLSRLIATRCEGRIDFMFLGNDERENIQAAELLLDDNVIEEFAGNSGKVIFHCRARINSIHRAIEDSRAGQRIRVKIDDSSHICVELLKLHEELLPVNCVDVGKDATVASPFNALVIGFGEVGCDAVRFLYEFGSFVDSRSTPCDVRRSPLHIDVVDRDMADLAGPFVANAPAVPVAMPFLKDGNRSDAVITLESLDCRSAEFYLKLEKSLPTLNYIVIATENDELNISLAIRILKLALRCGTDLDRFRILARIKDDTNGYFRRIALHYNRMARAQTEAGDNLTQTRIKRNANLSLPIFLFGSDQEIFTYENIISDNLEERARQFHNLYDSVIGTAKIPGATDAWESAYMKLMQLDEDHLNYYPPYGAAMALRRMRGQDFANSLHILTKQKLAGMALRASGKEGFDWQTISRNNMSTVYRDAPDDIAAILTNLARTEHLRWNASHEILGYSPGSVKDEVKMLHKYLKSWQKLSADTHTYDYNVVDISLGIPIIGHNQN